MPLQRGHLYTQGVGSLDIFAIVSPFMNISCELLKVFTMTGEIKHRQSMPTKTTQAVPESVSKRQLV